MIMSFESCPSIPETKAYASSPARPVMLILLYAMKSAVFPPEFDEYIPIFGPLDTLYKSL